MTDAELAELEVKYRKLASGHRLSVDGEHFMQVVAAFRELAALREAVKPFVEAMEGITVEYQLWMVKRTLTWADYRRLAAAGEGVRNSTK